MTSTATHRRRLRVKWTAPKGLAALILFFIISLIIQVLLVSAFQTLGLSDPNAWASTLQVPGTNWSFTVSVSPLFHLLPLSVIIVLLASWAYLTKSTAFIPQRAEAARRPAQPPRRARESRRFKSARRFFGNISRKLQRFGRRLKSGVQKTPGVGYISQRLSFARIAVRSALTILAIFILVAAGLLLIEYPDLIYHLTLNMYAGSPALHGFVIGVGQWLQGVGISVPPLSDLGTSINNALVSAAPGFRRSLEAAGTSLTSPIFQLDVVGKYALSQNLAAWTAAVLALLYSAYASTRRRIKGR